MIDAILVVGICNITWADSSTLDEGVHICCDQIKDFWKSLIKSTL
jgi:hypothetical protein